jgi:osmoprotectant transport system substrate-binding protein
MRIYRTLALGAASLALVMSACTPGGSGSTSPSGSAAGTKPTIKVGSQTFWEAEVVGEMYALALEANGYTVERHLAISPEHPPVLAALEADQINLTPEYLGGLTGAGLGLESLASDPQEASDSLRDPLAEKGWVIFDFSPGSDSDGFAVRQETADEMSLSTISDLAGVADQLVWGVAEGCPENPVCAPGLKEVYGIDLDQIEEAGNLEFLSACSSDIAGSLSDGTIDVAQVCTTQPEILALNLKLLEDDMHLQPAQNLVPLARQDLIDAAPDIEATLNAIQAKLTTEALTQLGVAIVIDQEDTADVARQFLEDNGLL